MVAEAQKCGMVRTSVGGDGINMERGGGEGAGRRGGREGAYLLGISKRQNQRILGAWPSCMVFGL